MANDKQNLQKRIKVSFIIGLTLCALSFLLVPDTLRQSLFSALPGETIVVLINIFQIIGSLLIGISIAMYYLRKTKVIFRIMAALLIAFIVYQLIAIVLNLYNIITMIPLGPV